MRFRLLVAALAAALPLSALRAAAAPAPRYSDILPISHLHRGMKGYGLTVFRGTKIERFNVTIVDVVRKGSMVVPGHDMILVRVSGGPLTQRGAYAIHGMSGSPVYINGKVIGAYSQAEPMTKEPLAGVTPIEDMLDAWDPKLPATPFTKLPDRKPRTVALREPLDLGTRRITRVVLNESPFSSRRSSGSTAVLRRCASILPVSGISTHGRDRLAKLLKPFDVEVVQGGGGGTMPTVKGASMVPGAALGMELVAGDNPLAATGTLTYRRGDRVLAFGHPFLGVGPIDAPLCSAYVHEVWPLLMSSYKLCSPGPVVGASSQDRPFSISGVIGKIPKTIPVTVDVRDLSTGRARVYHDQVVNHPSLSGTLVSLAVMMAVSDLRDIPIAAGARVETTVDADELGKITRTNTFFDPSAIDQVVTTDLDEIAGILTSNPFYPLAIKSVHVRADIETGHQTATIQRVFLREGKLAPGDTADIGVVLKPYRKPSVTTSMKLRIPLNAPTGKLMLEVRGGAASPSISFGGMVFRMASAGSDQSPPVSAAQMVKRMLEREKSNEVVARLVLPTTAVSVEGETLNGLPPSLDAIMRSAKSSAVKLDRDEVKTVQPTDWVVSGRQMLLVTVQRKDLRELPTGSMPPGSMPMPGAMPMQLPDGGQPTEMPMIGDDYPDPSGSVSTPTGDDNIVMADKKPTAPPKSPEKPAVPAPVAPAATPDSSAAPAEAAAPSGPSTPSEKSVVRGPQVWKQAVKADFDKGDPHGVCVTSAGTLALAPTMKRLASSTESFAWALAPGAAGSLYVGTGTQGRVLQMTAAGETKVIAKLPEESVHALLTMPNGTIMAATGPHGRTYRISPDGKAEVAYDAPEKYALALAKDGAGNVYVGTGGGSGVIYKLGADGKATPFFASTEEHILCLATDAGGNLYAGTAPNGLVYKIAPNGKSSVIYDCPEQSVTGVGVASSGVVYACTAPKGVIYRIGTDGTTRALTDRPLPAFTGLVVGRGDTVYATSGSTVFTVGIDDVVRALDRPAEVDLLSVATATDGTVYAGAGNTADVYATSPITGTYAGQYDSIAHDAKAPARWGELRWIDDEPAGAKVAFETRTGNAAQPDASWSPWTPVQLREPKAGRIDSPCARFIQYRAKLTSTAAGATPVVRSVAISLLPKNLPPKITLQAPSGGERWSGQQTIRWAAADPDSDTLSFDVEYSADDGAHWASLPQPAAPKPAVAVAKPEAGGKKPTTGKKPAKSGPKSAPTMAEVSGVLDRHPEVPAAMRDEIMKRAQALNAPDDDESADDAAMAAPPPMTATPGKESSKALDTRTLKDGTYRIRVTASDRPANADDPQTATIISQPFVVCNAAPVIVVSHSSVSVGADRIAALSGVAFHKTAPITAVQFRVDTGQWMAASATDGVFDSDLEAFNVRTTAMTPGQHVIEIRAYQAAGVTATEKVTVEAK